MFYCTDIFQGSFIKLTYLYDIFFKASSLILEAWECLVLVGANIEPMSSMFVERTR